MEANEAPEKIYLDSYGSGFSHGFHTNKLNDNDIEYIRTDVCIEKASEWFKIRYEWIDIDGSRNYDKSAFEDFKNYMKDESNIY